jgi:hypothetical protein
MFIGHFGLGLAGKALAPRVSLATWFMSVQLPSGWPPGGPGARACFLANPTVRW